MADLSQTLLGLHGQLAGGSEPVQLMVSVCGVTRATSSPGLSFVRRLARAVLEIVAKFKIGRADIRKTSRGRNSELHP